MFGSEIIDFALSICFLFFLLSIIASTLLEAFNAQNTKRAHKLQAHIMDFAGEKIGKAIYANPIVNGLTLGTSLPAYIPSDIFAAALLEEYNLEFAARAAVPALNRSDKDTDAFNRVQTLIKTLSLTATTAPDQVKAIAKWFDDAMSRLSGQYKRQSQHWLFVIGLVTAILWNANTLAMIEQLWSGSMARSVATAAVKVVAPDPSAKGQDPDTVSAKTAATNAVNVAANINLPMGWKAPASASNSKTSNQPNNSLASELAMTSLDDLKDFTNPFKWLFSLAGWLLTAFLVSLGAPFWFDLLGRFSNLRGNGVKPPDTSQPAKP